MDEKKIVGNDFKIKFDGQQHQVDANVLVSSLIHTTTIIQEVNKYLNSGKKIEIKVKAPEKGSFLCHIELVETTLDSLKNLLTKDNIATGAQIIEIVVGLIVIKKFLKGKKAKEVQQKGDKTEIINKDGGVIIIENATFNIYDHSSVIKDALAQNFDILNNDPAITGFEITDKNEKTLVKVDKQEFADLSQKSEELEEGERKLIEAATINVVRVSFESNLKWDFYYRGIKISDPIKDPSFYELINKGKAFAKGDILQVDLQIHQKFDTEVNTFVTKSYQVNKINKHCPGMNKKK